MIVGKIVKMSIGKTIIVDNSISDAKKKKRDYYFKKKKKRDYFYYRSFLKQLKQAKFHLNMWRDDE